MPDPQMMGQYIPGTASFGQLNLQGAGVNTINGPIQAVGGVLGTRAWLYQHLEPTGVKASSIGGRLAATTPSAPLTSGTVHQAALPVEAGVSICHVGLCSIAAQVNGTHAWVGVADSSNRVLTVSNDMTAAVYFTADSLISTPVPLITTIYSGLYYLFVCVVADTTPTFASAPSSVSNAIMTASPTLCGTSLTGQTTPVAVGSSLGAITPAAGYQLYGYLT